MRLGVMAIRDSSDDHDSGEQTLDKRSETDRLAHAGEASPTEARLLGRLLLRLLPGLKGVPAVVSEADIPLAVKRWHWIVSGVLLTLVWSLTVALGRLWPPAKATAVSMVAGVAGNWVDYTWTLTVLTLLVMLYLMRSLFGKASQPALVSVAGPHGTQPSATFGGWMMQRLRELVLHEEQLFREGSEHWSMWQRVRTCVVFGLIHFANLIYPVAVLIPLMAGAAFFMGAYLRRYRQTGDRTQAVLEASALHYTYNRLALSAAVVIGPLYFAYSIWALRMR
jgi:hypothetical protein